MDYIAFQAPLSMRFFRQEHWSELPCPSLGNLPDPRIKPTSPILQADSLSLSYWAMLPLGYYVKWNKADQERQISSGSHLYAESKNQKKKGKKRKAKHNKRRLIDMGTNGQLPERRKTQSAQNKWRGLKVQPSSYKINKPQRCKIQYKEFGQ